MDRLLNDFDTPIKKVPEIIRAGIKKKVRPFTSGTVVIMKSSRRKCRFEPRTVAVKYVDASLPEVVKEKLAINYKSEAICGKRLFAEQALIPERIKHPFILLQQMHNPVNPYGFL